MIGGLFAVVLLVGLCVYWWIATSNNMRRLEIKIAEAESGIDVALTKRYDLLTKMRDVVRAYARHERETLIETVHMRGGMSVPEKSKIAAMLDQAKSEMVFLAEAYPELGSSKQYLHLQITVAEVEDHLQGARRAYNANVSLLNQKLAAFPSSLVGKRLGLTPHLFFEAAEEKRGDISMRVS